MYLECFSTRITVSLRNPVLTGISVNAMDTVIVFMLTLSIAHGVLHHGSLIFGDASSCIANVIYLHTFRFAYDECKVST